MVVNIMFSYLDKDGFVLEKKDFRDSKFWKLYTLAGNGIMVNLMFLICSLPVVTMGASMTALHKAMRLYVVKGEKRLFQSFFEAFKKHFKLSTCVWLLNLLMILILCFDLLF